ncbi:MAG TPA: serine/threonine-protein kinase [Candidatus Limnocylindria bacterium]|jgi:serine/threonine protein kinase|nr:serine/threonine-protein kinase [Candidatus Limnocylindria bacterium]
MQPARNSLKLVACPHCGAKVFISGDLAPLEKTPCSKCGQPIMMPMQLRQFELQSEIASGGMGTVFRAYDTTLGRIVAVKLMKQEIAQDEEAVNAFAAEARACASLNHTNIIHIYTFDQEGPNKYLVMELADAGSLDERIETLHRVPELDILDIGVKVASALAAALKHGLLHLDIKPGNILFAADGEPKLVDFGLARKTDVEKDSYAPVYGTPYYIAPERVQQTGESFLSDMYSLAGTLYHALVGHVPFEAATVEEVVSAQIHTALTPAHVAAPDVTVPTSEALQKAMAKNPAERFQNYDEFRLALEAARSQVLIAHFTGQSAAAAPAREGKSWWRR